MDLAFKVFPYELFLPLVVAMGLVTLGCVSRKLTWLAFAQPFVHAMLVALGVLVAITFDFAFVASVYGELLTLTVALLAIICGSGIVLMVKFTAELAAYLWHALMHALYERQRQPQFAH